jgi:hypothetical protein
LMALHRRRPRLREETDNLMTCEVAVMNKRGVALAAIDVALISNGDGFVRIKRKDPVGGGLLL